MLRDDIRRAQEELRQDMLGYLTRRRPEMEQRAQQIEQKGALSAASEDERIANALHASEQEGVFLQRTVGSDDKAPIFFLERGARAARAVCRIVDGNGTALGTGFLVGPGLLVTNNHVLPSANDAQDAFAEFFFELDADENPLRAARYALNPARLFATSPKGAFDFTFVAVAPTGQNGEDLKLQGWLPLDERPNKILDGQPVVIIQHPDGQMKAICLFDSICVFRDKDADKPYLLYTTDTDFGSSGSPAFNRFWQVIALHHASVDTGDKARGKPVIMNRGIRISSIFKALAAGPQDGKVQGSSAHVMAIHRILTDPQTRKRGRPFATTSLVSSNTAEEVTPEAKKKKASATVIRRKEVDHFDGRRGYDPMFLASSKPHAKPKIKNPLHVPLPQMPDWLAADAAPLKDNPDGHDLKYEHFSIVMSASRRLAMLTACNVHGGQMMRLDRKDRDPDDPLDPDIVPEAAADIWFYDPRLDDRYQLGPELYDQTSFDYGHLVRRLDPVWGRDPRTSRIANDDTFCMTNCSPQETRFHRTRKDKDGNWSALEDVILSAFNEADQKASIFTGPVLDARDDPTILGVRVPTAFWKIVAYVKNGDLRARGFMLWQDDEVGELDEQFEAAIDLSKASRPVPIREIARLTGLDFGPLFKVDALSYFEEGRWSGPLVSRPRSAATPPSLGKPHPGCYFPARVR